MLDIRYVAGLFDGEGYVRINEWQKPNSPHIRFNVFVGINMTYRPLIEMLQQQFGGGFNVNRHDLRNPKQRACFAWNLGSSTAANFLREILPYLIVKREEAEIALLLQANIDEYRHKLGSPFGGYHPQRDEIFAYRRSLAAQITALKRRTFDPIVDRAPATQ